PLPAGFRAPSWNGYLLETHYVYSPQLIFIQRSEWERMSKQADPSAPSNLGNIDMYTFGFRYMPIMTSRAGFAWHNEYSWIRQRGTSPVTFTDLTSSSLMSGFDFDF
ncbi:MAG TPA: CRISPR-associated DxTHG motif protein, partial [Terriglobales bacterium]